MTAEQSPSAGNGWLSLDRLSSSKNSKLWELLITATDRKDCTKSNENISGNFAKIYFCYHRSPKHNEGLYGEFWLKHKSLYQNKEMTLKSFNVWVIYHINTLEHSMLKFFILESLNKIWVSFDILALQCYNKSLLL